jgi:predicted Zn-ribbon and HTH transcriptional regulator
MITSSVDRIKIQKMDQTKNFQRKIEDFKCGNCGYFVVGDGFTNHCPKCLWSKHVDVNPGDREEICGGMMKPISVKLENGEYFITHKCVQCGFERRKKVEKEDDFDEVIKI